MDEISKKMLEISELCDSPDNPRNAELVSLIENAKDLPDIVSRLEVMDAETEHKAAMIFAECDVVCKRIDERRKAKVTPFNEVVKSINAYAKSLAAPFATAKEISSKKMNDWRSQEAIRDAEEQRNSANRNAFHSAQEGDLDKAQGFADEAADLSAAVPKTVGTDSGSIRFRTDIVIDEVDFTQVDERYVVKTADEKAIKESIKAGANPKGVKWHEERTPINYRA